jgi:GT2 family glycosyltransferase
MPFFSVIIPTFNRAGLLVEALNSVRGQTFPDFEVIVVDDGSTDDTLERLGAFPEVKVFTQQNRGPGAARNFGMRNSSGMYLAFLDSDDVWFPWTLETYAAILGGPAAPAFMAGKPVRFMNQSELPTNVTGALELNVFRDYLASGDEWRWFGVSSFVILSKAFRTAGGFSEENLNGEDADLALKLGDAPGFTQITSPATFGYRDHATNVTADLAKSLAGVHHIVLAEKSNEYVGGKERELCRRQILTRIVRSITLDCLKKGQNAEAWRLYGKTFFWHCALRRWKYLVCFPIIGFISAFKVR